MENVTVIESRVYKVYFENPEGYDPYEIKPPGHVPPDFSCCVIAGNANEAMRKLAAAFPDRIVTSIHCDGTSGIGSATKDKVVF